MFNASKREQFEDAIRPHLSSAYNLARYLTQNEADAEDVLQESLVRAFRFFDRGRELRPWFLQIVRNASYSYLKKNRRYRALDDLELVSIADPGPTAETNALEKITTEEVRATLLALPPQFREVLVLRELEEMPYRDIAKITGLAEGTVMSRLSRARAKFREIYLVCTTEGGKNERGN